MDGRFRRRRFELVRVYMPGILEGQSRILRHVGAVRVVVCTKRSLGVVFCGSHLSFHRFSKRARVGCEPPCWSELAALARWHPRSPSCAAARVNPRTRPYPTLRKHRLHHDVSKTRACRETTEIRPRGFHVVDVAAVVVGGARGAAGFATDRHEAIQFSTPQWSPAASVLLTALAQATAA